MLTHYGFYYYKVSLFSEQKINDIVKLFTL